MAEELSAEVEIAEDKSLLFRRWSQIESFLKHEAQEWAWLEPNNQATDQFGVASHVHNQIQDALGEVANWKSANEPVVFANDMLARFSPNGTVFPSTSPTGIRILDIRAHVGDRAAAFAYGLERRMYGLDRANCPEHLRGAMLTAFPGMADPTQLAERMNKERSNYRYAIQTATQRLEDERIEQAKQAVDFLAKARGITARALQLRAHFWKSATTKWQGEADAAVADIRATESAYKEAMKLQASVEYWRTKATDHGAKESEAIGRLKVFFPIALLGMIAAFGLSGFIVISDANANHGNVPTALYVVLSGGLAVFTTMVFWIGRLLTKLYLSEHHLRNDAEERAVMTTTYLALTKEHAAEEADRQIVLTALFRSTPDGIVRDDGPVDASIQALVAKALAR
ncbi:DUF6161 domain-containing protein [Sphingomonas sp. Sphisp140]|uniref:DUF6161 domain-containing protein n=1 Tax=unclassified Sphingomonas TaxID=196159 RepID=UPI0039AF7012